MSSSPKKAKKLPVFWITFLGGLVVLVIMVLIQPDRPEVDPKQLPWNAKVDEAGRIHTLGLIVNESNLNDAIALYGNDIEMKIFTDKSGENKSLEVYYPSLYIGTIKTALALKVAADSKALDEAYNRGVSNTVTQTGSREIELLQEDTLGFYNAPISSITLIPRRSLDERAIAMRFGEPDKKEVQSDGLKHWFFNQKGLELIIDEEGPEALQYYKF